MSTQGVGPGGALTGLNPQRDPQVVDFYKENIPRGNSVLYKAKWEQATTSTNAVVEIPHTGPFTVNRGINDNFIIYVDSGLQQIIELDPNYYTLESLANKLAFHNVTTEIVNGKIYLSSLLYGSNSKIRIGNGTLNSTLGLMNEFVARGTDPSHGTSPSILVNLQQDNFNATIDFFKTLKFTASEDLDFGNCVITLLTKHNKYFFGEDEDAVASLMASCDPNSISNFKVKSKNWYSGQVVFPTPIKISSAEADFLRIVLYDKSRKDSSTTGLKQGTLFITLEGWSTHAGLQ